jgi:hypothetical protein
MRKGAGRDLGPAHIDQRKEAIMTHKLKGTGLALAATFVAMFTLGVVVSSASAADLFTVPKAPSTLKVTGGTSEINITGTPIVVKCHHFKGVVEATSTATKEVTVKEITYTGKKAETENHECESSVSDVTIDMNGCDYDLTGETTGKDEEKWDATTSITCPVFKEITITTKAGCTIHIHEQTSTSGGATYTNGTGANGKPDVTVHVTMTGITYSTKGAFCSLGKLPEEGNTLDTSGTYTFEAAEGVSAS